MVLNIVKNNLSISHIVEYIERIFDGSEVVAQKDYGISVDISITAKNHLYSLEGLKELEYYFKDYDVRIR